LKVIVCAITVGLNLIGYLGDVSHLQVTPTMLSYYIRLAGMQLSLFPNKCALILSCF